VKKILETFPELTQNDVKSTSMGASGRDVQLSEAALTRFNYDVECKNRAAFAIYTDFEQSTTRAGTAEPCLVIKANHKQPLAVITLDHFMELLNARKKTSGD
jgi:hypothetical protein